MLKIKKNPCADTRTCDYTQVTKKQLLDSSFEHQGRPTGFGVFRWNAVSIRQHDRDKVTDIDGFYADFQTGFKQTGWWDNHRRVNRHHLAQEDGIPENVNLIDALDFVADCVVAGMARSGEVRHEFPQIPPELLVRAFQNTVELLKSQVVVEE